MIRKHFAGFVASALALAVSAQAFAGTVTTDGTDIVVKTKGGLEVFTTDKEYSFKLGGRIQADFDQFDGFYTANNNSANESYFRRAILELTGNYKDWRYVFNYDFANGQANNGAGGVGGSGTNGSSSNNWDEASIAYTGFSPITIKAGRFDPDFGLQHATSSKWTTFIERAAIYDLAPWVNNKQDDMGIQVSGVTGGMFYGSTGIYQQETSTGELESNNGMDVNSFVARGVFAPIVSETEVLHFGADFAQRNYDKGRYQGSITSNIGVRGIAEDSTNNTPTPVFAKTATNRFYTDDQVMGLEAAYMTGPLSIETEYLHRGLSGQDSNGDRDATGYTAQVAYTLTGESRAYKLDGGKFDAIKPLNKSTGAWEIFYRYENLAVKDDNNLSGASLTSTTGIDKSKATLNVIGVNWYANEAVKLSLDYLVTSTDSDTLALQAGLTSAEVVAPVRTTTGADDKNGQAVSARLQYLF
ncbi:MAG: porin [Pseudomonadaceae bacterium]|nr:porin [Pseudomonadaceae bacterium]